MSLTINNAFGKAHNGFLSSSSENQLLLKPNGPIQTENNNQPAANDSDKTYQVWSQYNFVTNNTPLASFNDKAKMTWADKAAPLQIVEDDDDIKPVKSGQMPPKEEEVKVEDKEETSPAHYARRPMNAFLIFCKKHRPIVRSKFPNLENRSVTKILGEWWALLEDREKAPFTNLAREHKDEFLSANPDFRWYKLPAPSLRTQTARPCATPNNNNKIPTPISSPTHHLDSEFTPGKLADESQLGSLTALMNSTFAPVKHFNNNNNEEHFAELQPPPLKPFKKRAFLDVEGLDYDSLTTQEIVDKTVEKNFNKMDLMELDEDNMLVRKSGRKGKGKRYEQFMVEGKLLGNKRDMKLTSQKSPEIEHEYAMGKSEVDAPNLDVTIRRLAERTSQKGMLEEMRVDTNAISDTSSNRISSCSNNNNSNKCSNSNLNIKIDNLPCLSYDVFVERKKDSKKRKRNRNEIEMKSKMAKIGGGQSNGELVGSKKRKNKKSITHLEKTDERSDALLALATLAEVAANERKINEAN